MAKTILGVSAKHGLVFVRNSIQIGLWAMTKRFRRERRARNPRYKVRRQFLFMWMWRGVRPKIDPERER